VSQGLPGWHEPALLALQAAEHLPLPTLLDPLDPHRRDVERYSGLEARAQESMHVGVRQAILAAVLMDREDSLGSASSAPESRVDRITHDALREMPVEPPEARRRGVVHGQDEAEVDWVPETRPSSRRAFRIALSSPLRARCRSPIP
jgi:hypothetical protein